MVTPVLAAAAVGKQFGSRVVLSAASLEAHAGCVTYLAGRNGQGKTTLLRICAGLVAPDSGTVHFGGAVYRRPRLHRLAHQGLFFLPARHLLPPHITLRTLIGTFARRFGMRDTAEIVERLALGDLLNARPASLSGGERRRAELALALIRQPRCLLADEPLRGVAPRDAELLLATLRHLADDGCAVVVTGHEAESLLTVCNAVVWVADTTTHPLGAPEEAMRDTRFRQHYLGTTGTVEPSTSPQARLATPSARTTPAARARTPSPPVSSTTALAVPPSSGHAPARAAAVLQFEEPADLVIDAQTLDELEILPSPQRKTSLFEWLDRTRTKGGRRRLLERFRRPPADAARIIATQCAVRFLQTDPQALALLPDESVLAELAHYRNSNYATGSATLAAARHAEGAWFRLRHGEILHALQQGVTTTVRFLDRLEGLATALLKAEAPAAVGEAARQLLAVLDGEAVRRLRQEAHHGLALPGHVLARDALIRDRLRTEFETLLGCVYDLDALRSLATASAEHELILPRVRQGTHPSLTIDGAYHPLVPNAVPNSFVLDADARLLFLTGPNMAGKTTYMRACALCIYLAHLGIGVPAQRMEMVPFQALLSSLSTSDNVQLGYSYFFSEVRRIKMAAELVAAGKRSFLVLDEPFKGTNVHDALEASRAVAAGLASKENVVCIVSSHLAELAPKLEATGAVQFQFFDADLTDQAPRYDFRLKRGVSTQRLGMQILEREGVLDLLG